VHVHISLNNAPPEVHVPLYICDEDFLALTVGMRITVPEDKVGAAE
jgi:hypothetical protein